MPRRAAQRASGAVDVPNIVLPLATSYNERGVAGYTHTVTNAEDQRKINCYYELAQNRMTGKGTLTLAKRNGVTIDSHTFGATTQTAYLSLNPADFDGNLLLGSGRTLVVNKDANLNQSSLSSGTVTILNSASFFPAFADITTIANLRNVVVQLRTVGTTGVHRVFFITATALAAGGPWTEIVDGDFTGLASHFGKMEHMDGFAFIMSNQNKIWNSDVGSIANWTLTSFITKQITQDNAVGLAKSGQLLLAFGENSAEPFYNAGNTVGSPLGRVTQFEDKVGLVRTALTGGTHYYATVGKRLFFVGRQAGIVGFYTFGDRIFEKVSTQYIDKILAEEVAADSIYSVSAIGLNGAIGIAVCVTAPGAATQRSFVFFPEWKDWFEWTSTVFSPVNDGIYCLGVGSAQNKVYSFATTDNWQDNAVSYPWSTQFKLPTNGSSTSFLEMYGVDADIDTSTNDLTVEISPDGLTFSTLGTIDQTQDRKVLFEGGSFTKAWIRLGNTNARPTRIHNFLARIS